MHYLVSGVLLLIWSILERIFAAGQHSGGVMGLFTGLCFIIIGAEGIKKT